MGSIYKRYSCGGMAMNHFKESKRIYRIKIKGVYDINGESMERAAKAGLYTYSSRSELINDSDVDLVLIAVPNHLHKFHPDLSLFGPKRVFSPRFIPYKLE